MSTSILDDLLVGKAPKNPFGKDENDQAAPIGTSVTGTVLEVVVRQTKSIETGILETWPDGNPKQQAIITLQTADRLDAEDDGRRNIYIKMWGLQKQALIEASKEAKGSPAPGDTFTATYTGVGKKTNPAFSAPKIYKYTIAKGNPLDAVVGGSTEATTPASEQFAAGPDAAVTAQIQKLIGVGLDDAKVSQALGVDEASVAAVRLQAAAAGSTGF